MNEVTLLIHCKDRSGIIAGVTSFINHYRGNIVYNDQFVDTENGIFFMRTEIEFPEKQFNIDIFKSDFRTHIAEKYEMSWNLFTEDYIPKMAVFVSKYDHCLYDILSRVQSGEWKVKIPFILSNHLDLEPVANSFGIPFHHVPFNREIRMEGEKKQLTLLEESGTDFIVLARYMQIITEGLIERYKHKIINIHHSFLPAFVGAKPYHSAFKRGVKIIGATSHYVTSELDAGPIIEQDVSRVSHTHSVQDLIATGRDLEKIVLARGIKLHLDRKTLVYNNKTVIFR